MGIPTISKINLMTGVKKDCVMKHYTKLFFVATVAALGLASCSKEVSSVEPPKDNLVTVHFGATAGIEGATKATLTPNEDETFFTSAWENGDELSVKYSFDVETKETTASWLKNEFCFEAQLEGGNGDWIYDVLYPKPSVVSFGSTRTQEGNTYNSKYDLMKGSATAEGADAGKTAEGKDIVFEMTRQTAIAYFHLTSALDEEVVSAKLSIEGDGAYLSTSEVKANEDYAQGYAFTETEGVASKEINLTFTGKSPMSSDFKLWFNVLPTTYSSMSLEVKTANHTLTLNKTKGGSFEAGKLYKIHKDNVTWTENKNVTFFYESFDSCEGTGGNDGKWSGSIASNTLSKENLDNPSWVFENEKSANKCAKLGTGDKAGKATTPALGINTSTATLSFNAGAWNGSSENTTIKVTANNGGTVEPSTITLKKGEWTDYTCTISGATEETTITFAASKTSNNRFFLDEVMVYYGNKPVVQHTQQISFSKTSVECYINDTFTEPILSGNKTTVTYSSSDEKVATVDATSGKVTILSAGKTEITATAEESEEYKTATAKYTLTVNKQTQNLSFEKGSYSVLLADKDSFVSPVVNGAKTPVSYSITLGEGVAQDAITIDPITEKVTINAVGTATITATAEESEVYETASASYVLTVTEKNPTGPTTVVIDLSKQNFKNEQEIKEVSSDPVSLIFNKGSNNNSPKYYTKGTAVRLYGGNTMTVSSSKMIVKVELTFDTEEGNNTITTDSETYLNGTWTGESNSIKFTVGGTSGHRKVQKVSVTYNL